MTNAWNYYKTLTLTDYATTSRRQTEMLAHRLTSLTSTSTEIHPQTTVLLLTTTD